MTNDKANDTANDAKASFDATYTAPTPHAYIAEMARTGYQIGEQARPYCVAAAELMREHNGPSWPVQMLDIGCSYGIGSAFVKFGCSFDEMVAFFATRAPRDYTAACDATRNWLHVTPPVCDVRTVGLDASAPAITFAVASALLDGGIARDFEADNATPTHEERAWFRSANLLISIGAIGYVTDRTLDVVLTDLGKDHPGQMGPVAVMTVLRMFDTAPIDAVFRKHGYAFKQVEGVRLPQRRFADQAERDAVLSVLHDRGIDTAEWEDSGKHFADLHIAAPESQIPMLDARMQQTHARQRSGRATAYIRR
jgi:hypothetical protein